MTGYGFKSLWIHYVYGTSDVGKCFTVFRLKIDQVYISLKKEENNKYDISCYSIALCLNTKITKGIF